jgi:hypothetical protein
MSQKLQNIFNGRIPYDWQLDAAEALILGLISTVLWSLELVLERLYHLCSLYLCKIPETSSS